MLMSHKAEKRGKKEEENCNEHQVSLPVSYFLLPPQQKLSPMKNEKKTGKPPR